jgi:hypothetical protein
MPANPPPSFIHSLIRRHAQDAAFYWSQLDGSLNATALTASRTQHFGRLLQAHLDGLVVAQQEGMQIALEVLERWRKPGEAFTAMWLALERAHSAAQWLAHPDQNLEIEQDGTLPPGRAQALAAQQMPAQVFVQAQRQPDMLLRGIISALAWVPEPAAQGWMQQAFASAEPVALVAALRACALRHWEVSPWAVHAQHVHPCVRAAACRCASAQDVSMLHSLLADTELPVRAEAAIALVRLLGLPPDEYEPGDTWPEQRSQWLETAASTLGACVLQQSQVCAEATGWDQMQSQRRLKRWLSHLAHAWPVGHPHAQTLLGHLPMRQALHFVLHHGDPEQLQFAVQCMQEPSVARYAGWVWQSLTGVDMAKLGYVLPEPPVDLDAPLNANRLDADQGLPLPNASAIAAVHAAMDLNAIPAQQRILQGQLRTVDYLTELLDPDNNASQALRAVAYQTLCALQPDDPPVSLRASLLMQLAAAD